MSRHPELNGADAFDDSGRADHDCDYCGKTVYAGLIRPVTIGRSTSWLCDACHERQEHRYAQETGDAQYAAEESAERAWKDTVPLELTFDEWLDWAGVAR